MALLKPLPRNWRRLLVKLFIPLMPPLWKLTQRWSSCLSTNLYRQSMDMVKMPDKAFNVVKAAIGYNFDTLFYQSETINSSARILNELLFADPLFWLYCLYNRKLKVERYFIRSYSKPEPELTVESQFPLLRSLTIQHDWYRPSSDEIYSASFPTWNRLRSLSVYGTSSFYPGVSQTLGSVFSGYTYPAGVINAKVDFSRFLLGGSTYSHISFDDLCAFARKMLAYVNVYYGRTTTLGRYGYHLLDGLSVTDQAIVYSLSNVTYQSFPASATMFNPNINITIERGDDQFGYSSRIVISGLRNTKIDNTPSIAPPRWSPHAHSTDHVTLATHEENISQIAYLESTFDYWIRDFAPALFISQARAFKEVMLQYATNFENILESPELVKLVYDVMFNSPLKGLWTGSLGQRIKALTLLISGSILAWSFAIKPSLDAVVSLVKGVMIPLDGEGEVTFVGEDINTLPTGLKALIQKNLNLQGLTITDLRSYDLRFRSVVYTTPDYAAVANAILSHNPLVKYGALPDPKGVWDASSGSFIVDWFFDIGGKIDYNTAYVRSPSFSFRIGHTVRLKLRFSDGRCYDLFFRSKHSKFPIDPPRDLWDKSPSVPMISIPLGVSQLFNLI